MHFASHLFSTQTNRTPCDAHKSSPPHLQTPQNCTHTHAQSAHDQRGQGGRRRSVRLSALHAQRLHRADPVERLPPGRRPRGGARSQQDRRHAGGGAAQVARRHGDGVPLAHGGVGGADEARRHPGGGHRSAGDGARQLDQAGRGGDRLRHQHGGG